MELLATTAAVQISRYTDGAPEGYFLGDGIAKLDREEGSKI